MWLSGGRSLRPETTHVRTHQITREESPCGNQATTHVGNAHHAYTQTVVGVVGAHRVEVRDVGTPTGDAGHRVQIATVHLRVVYDVLGGSNRPHH